MGRRMQKSHAPSGMGVTEIRVPVLRLQPKNKQLLIMNPPSDSSLSLGFIDLASLSFHFLFIFLASNY